jgi:APA family basic amino acid/polyamine antiporter
MASPTVNITEQMLRRRPVIGAPVAHGASDHLKRTIGTFQLTMFGVGATVGTGIFIILRDAVPLAGPAVIISFIIAGVAAALAAICYAELASAVPVSGSTYSYAYTTMGELVAMAVAGCLLLEYGVSTASVAVGWKSVPKQTLHQSVRHPVAPRNLRGALGHRPRFDQSPGDGAGGSVCAAADSRRQ